MRHILAAILAFLILVEILYFLYFWMGKFFNFGKTYFYITFYRKFYPKKILIWSVILDLILFCGVLFI